MERTAETLLALTGAKSVRAMAAQSGIDPSTLNRQTTGKSGLTVETVVSLCRTYSLDIASAFVAVGFITQDEADRLGRTHSLSEYTDLELAQEIVDRLEAEQASAALTDPISLAPTESNVIDGGFGQNANPPQEEERYVAHPEINANDGELMDE